jgi:hypothetical protein
MAGIAASKQGAHWQLFVISEKPWLANAALRAATVPSADDVEAGLGGRVEWQKIDEAHAGVRAPSPGRNAHLPSQLVFPTRGMLRPV